MNTRRHDLDALRGFAILLGIVLHASVSFIPDFPWLVEDEQQSDGFYFLFAAIHPQGWIAIPALMGIAIGMNLMREWRGTVIPSMVVHGVSNGLVTSMMLIFLSN